MKKILTLALLTFVVNAYSQTANPKNFKTVKFVYSQKSNLEFDQRGVYGDTLALKALFPGNNYIFQPNPKDSSKTSPFIPYYAIIRAKNMGNLRYHLYHTNITTEATYNPRTKKTEYYNYYCPDEELKKLLIFLKGSRCNRNKSAMGTIDYSDNINIKHVGLSIPIKEIAKSLIQFQGSTKIAGTYDEHINFNLTNQEFDITYLVEFDSNLNKHITPIDIFANSDFGVKKVSNPFYTIELISVSYQ